MCYVSMENFGTKPGRSISLPYEMIRLWKRIQDRSSNIMRDNSCLKELDDRKAPGARLPLLDLKKNVSNATALSSLLCYGQAKLFKSSKGRPGQSLDWCKLLATPGLLQQ